MCEKSMETELARPELAALEEHPYISVLIIGGGINGIGLFYELALQGIDVLLVEKSDFCSGTSAAMTRVIHGGLRYLENAEFRLVRESLRERNGCSETRPITSSHCQLRFRSSTGCRGSFLGYGIC